MISCPFSQWLFLGLQLSDFQVNIGHVGEVHSG